LGRRRRLGRRTTEEPDPCDKEYDTKDDARQAYGPVPVYSVHSSPDNDAQQPQDGNGITQIHAVYGCVRLFIDASSSEAHGPGQPRALCPRGHGNSHHVSVIR